MKLKSYLKSAALLLSSAGMAFGTTITFENLPVNLQTVQIWNIANGYDGLDWNNFVVLDGANSGNSGYQAGTVSGNNVAYNNYANPATISGSAFDLTSGYFTSAWNDNLQLEAQGYVNGNLTYDNFFILSATVPSQIIFNYLDVDQVTFVTSGGTQHSSYSGSGAQFVLDDLTINESRCVPDAGTTGLMLSTVLVGLGVLRKRLS